jgi:hypothetical protein
LLLLAGVVGGWVFSGIDAMIWRQSTQHTYDDKSVVRPWCTIYKWIRTRLVCSLTQEHGPCPFPNTKSTTKLLLLASVSEVGCFGNWCQDLAMKHTSEKSIARPACTIQMDKNDIQEAQTHVCAQ